jgi:uncharacterized protein
MARVVVEVVYALPHGEDAARVALAPGSTVRDAIERSGIARRHPELDLERQKVGIFGRVVAQGATVRDGDRIEIYRPLALDPKAARRLRAAKARR